MSSITSEITIQVAKIVKEATPAEGEEIHIALPRFAWQQIALNYMKLTRGSDRNHAPCLIVSIQLGLLNGDVDEVIPLSLTEFDAKWLYGDVKRSEGMDESTLLLCLNRIGQALGYS